MFCLSRHLALRNEPETLLSIISDEALVEKTIATEIPNNKKSHEDVSEVANISRANVYKKVSIKTPSGDTDTTEALSEGFTLLSSDSCDSLHTCLNEGENNRHKINENDKDKIKLEKENVFIDHENQDFDNEYSEIIDLPSYSSEETEEENFMSLEADSVVINDEQGLRQRINRNNYRTEQMVSEDLAWEEENRHNTSFNTSENSSKMVRSKSSDGWLNKIGNPDKSRPFMVRVGSTCVTLNHIVNEGQLSRSKNESE